jgi:hypothetical protein
VGILDDYENLDTLKKIVSTIDKKNETRTEVAPTEKV